MIDIKKTVGTALEFARFFFRSPKDVAVENFTGSGTALIAKILSLPEFYAAENDFETLVKTFGWGVEKDPATGHISALQQPAGRWEMTQGGHVQWIPGGKS